MLEQIMKNIKRLFWVIGLFIQGCNSEIPLFKDEDGVKSDEAVVVFNMYIPNDLYGGIFVSDWNFYLNSIWVNDALNLQQKVESQNYIRASSINHKYAVVKLKPGHYYLSTISGQKIYYDGIGHTEVNYYFPIYAKNQHPLSFTVNSGEVVYLGDIEVEKPADDNRSFTPKYKVIMKTHEARKFIEEKYPKLSKNLFERQIKQHF
jgi:hypothetical protein